MPNTEQTKKKVGRPSSFTQETADAICEHIASGKALASFCAVEGSPGWTTVMRWLRDNEAFRNDYARAREDQAHRLAEEIIAIADDDSRDEVVDPETGHARFNTEFAARSKIRIDARKWYAGKLNGKYSEKIALGGSNDMPAFKTANLNVTVPVENLTPDQLRALASIPLPGEDS